MKKISTWVKLGIFAVITGQLLFPNGVIYDLSPVNCILRTIAIKRQINLELYKTQKISRPEKLPNKLENTAFNSSKMIL